MTKNNIDINKLIEEKYIVPESVFDRKRTKTSHFMLNTIFPNSSLMATEYFVNAFLDDRAFKHSIIRPLFLLFKASDGDQKWNTILSRMRLKSEYVLEYFCGLQEGKNLTMIVFQVPDRFAKEYRSFKQGKYSEFSADYKRLFPKYTHNEKQQSTESVVWRVINKSKELRKELEKFFTVTPKYPYIFDEEDELWGIVEPEYEIYRYKQPE